MRGIDNMKQWMLDTGCWMMDHYGVVITGVVLLMVLVVRLRRRRARRPMKWLDLTGVKCLAVPGLIYDKAMVDAIADRSFAAGLFIGGMAVVSIGFLLLVFCLRGSGNRARNGRGVS